MAADVVVVNHHLFFADLALRDSGVAELLPSVEVGGVRRGASARRDRRAVPGHAARHRRRCSTSRATCWRAGLQQARGLVPGRSWPRPASARARDLRLAARRPRCGEVRGEPEAALGRARRRRRLRRRRWQRVGEACAAAARGARHGERARARLRRAAERAAPLARAGARASPSRAEAGQVRWIDLTPQQVRLVESPLDIREALREQMRRRAPQGLDLHLGDARRRRAAELVHRDAPASSDATVLRVGSPFDYARAARAVRAARLSQAERPGARARGRRRSPARCARALGGRTFVLTTTLRALRADRRRAARRLDAAGRRHRGAGAGPGAQARS